MNMALDWFPEAAWKGSAVLAVLFLVARAVGRDAAARHLVWTLGLAVVLAMPLLTELLPWRLPIRPAVLVETTPAIPSDWRPDRDKHQPKPEAPETISRNRSGSASVSEHGQSPATGALRPLWSRIAPMAPLVWAAGFLLFGGRLLLGFLTLGVLGRRGRRLDEPEWRDASEVCARRLGLRAVPRLFQSPDLAMPCTSGWLRPIILLPTGALEWDSARREVVLLHELAHVRRRDFLPHLVAQIVCALHWFNPLVWLAARRLRAEAERASDELVVRSGARPSEYAAHLLDIVRGSTARWHPASVLPMAHRTEFEGRLLAILESTGGRGMPTPRTALATSVLVLALTIPLAAVGAAPPVPKAVSLDDQLGREGEPPELSFDFKLNTRTATKTTMTTKMDHRMVGQGLEGGSETSAALAMALSDPVGTVRQAAAEALGSARDTIAVRALMEALRTDTDAGVRRSAAWALGQIEDASAIPALGEALLRDTDVEVRKHAAWALGEIEDARGVAPLAEALRREAHVEVRTMIAWALGAIEDPAAVDALTSVLDRGQDPAVRKAAVEALADIEDAKAVPALLPLLREADPEMRRAAAYALGTIEDRAAVEGLLAVIRDDQVEVRRAVVEALGSIEDRRAAPALAAALSDRDVEVRRAAAHAIGDLDELRQAPAELIEALRDPDREVRHAALNALGSIEDPAAVPGLVALLRDPDVGIRRAVVEALDDIDDPSATSALRNALRDEDPEVRRQAAKALGNRSR